MKRLLIVLLSIAILLPVIGVAQVVDPTVSRGIEPVRGLANNPVIEGENQLTGLPTDAPYIPVLVNIDNVAGAWPQWGIVDADIIYELPIDGLSLTRLMALFGYRHPQDVGPVRSGRIMHAEMREEWDAAWVYVGVQEKKGSNVNDYLRKHGVRSKPVNLLFDGTGNRYGYLFGAKKGYKNPHHHSIDLTKIAQEVSAYTFPQRPFLFTDELPETGVQASRVDLKYGTRQDSYSNSYYIYDEQTNQYTRYRDNTLYVDANQPDAGLTFSNLIVQWTELKFNGASNAPLLKEVGEGNADIFTGGRYIAGYWVRESVGSRTVFYDENGEEIRLQRGKTFINVVSDRATTLSYEE
ncbi:MAG: DUF3048 domain-containing protein [Christensenellales bacterium]